MNRRLLVRLLILAVIAASGTLVFVYRANLTPQMLEALIGDLGIWGPIVYVLAYLAAPTLLVPGSAITLAAGALFGPVWGTLYAVLGSVGGATLAFLLGRYLAGDWVERKASGILLQVKEGVEAEGWRFVAFVRLVPLFPFVLLNYALGLTRIPLRTYVVTSALCMFPGTAGYVYLGFAGREALLGGEDVLRKVSLAVGVFAALAFLPLLVRRLRAMRRRPAGAPGGTGKAQQPPAPTRE